jgi:hypothetical protein
MVLMRLALVVRYGDLSDRVERCSADLRSTLKWDDHEMSAPDRECRLGALVDACKDLTILQAQQQGFARVLFEAVPARKSVMGDCGSW